MFQYIKKATFEYIFRVYIYIKHIKKSEYKHLNG